MTTLVHHLLRDAAEANPDGTALIHGATRGTYAEVAARAGRTANALRELGVRPGDRVLLALENGLDWVASYFGIQWAGGIVVPLAAGRKSDRLPAVVADCSPTACIVDTATAHHFEQVFREARTRVIAAGHRTADAAAGTLHLDQALASAGDEPPDVSRIDIDLAAIVYTSGSTGIPRGVMLSHLNILSNTRSIVGYLGLVPSDRVMVVLPFYYVFGLSLLHTHVAVGGTVVIDNRFAFPNAVVKTMQEQEVTNFAGVPSTYAILMHHSNLEHTPLPALRFCIQAGGAMPPALVREWLDAMPGVPLVVMYGATEASARLCYLPPCDLPRKLGSIGRAIPNVEMRVRREDGSEAGAGETGELVARGSNIASGYWNAPEETAAAFQADGYHTGDLGYRDADGYLYVVGRSRDMLKVGAHRVAAKEIEDVLHEHPSIHETAVVGAPHELLGEAPVAFVVPRQGQQIEPEALTSHCRSRLPEHKVPVRFERIDELPKNESGKINKHPLREMVSQADQPKEPA